MKEQLINTLYYVNKAIENWSMNKYNATQEKAEKELKYFQNKKITIQKELKKWMK